MLDRMQIEDLTIEIVIEKSKRKSLAISITEEGKLSIKAPIRMTDREIEKFLYQKSFGFINRQNGRRKNRKTGW